MLRSRLSPICLFSFSPGMSRKQQAAQGFRVLRSISLIVIFTFGSTYLIHDYPFPPHRSVRSRRAMARGDHRCIRRCSTDQRHLLLQGEPYRLSLIGSDRSPPSGPDPTDWRPMSAIGPGVRKIRVRDSLDGLLNCPNGRKELLSRPGLNSNPNGRIVGTRKLERAHFWYTATFPITRYTSTENGHTGTGKHFAIYRLPNPETEFEYFSDISQSEWCMRML